METVPVRVENAIYTDKDGKETEDFENALAYKTAKSFYVREFKARLYEKGEVVRRHDRERYKWRKVGPLCYGNYLKYLVTNQSYCYNLADRHRND